MDVYWVMAPLLALLAEHGESAGSSPVGTPIWVPLLIVLIVLLLLWWGLTRNTIVAAPAAHDHDAEHDDHAGHDEGQADHASDHEVTAVRAATSVLAETQAMAETAVTSEPDDLKLIEGIGPKIAAVLNGTGITTFAQLAETSVARLNQIVREDAGITIAFPDTWPEQAALAAAGKWDELETLQEDLKGGRRE